MRQIVLGSSGEKVPIIGMGTARMGSIKSKRQQELDAIREGINLGMTLIDTAEEYGNGDSERLVGEAIKGQREKVFIATKVGTENFSFDNVIKACDRSLERLGVSFIDLYQLHWPSRTVNISDTIRAMESLVNLGKIRYIGLSNFSVGDFIDVHSCLKQYEVMSDQLRYNYFDRTIETGLLKFCEQMKMTVISSSPLNMMNVGQVERFSQETNQTESQFMLSWVTRSGNVCAIPKASNVFHVEVNSKTPEWRTP
jgi:diketogulonate reductase-like aldo/keto reductase